jgi:folate-binding protein YgfZ
MSVEIANSESATKEYRALINGAAVLERSGGDVLVMTDNDRVDFMQRMTTNDIAALQPGQSTVTVLTSSTARVLFAFTVLCQPDALIVLPAPGQAAALEKHLRGQIFFMDKVKIENRSADHARLRLMGPDAASALEQLGFDLADVADGAFAERDDVVAVKQRAYDVPGYELLVPVAQQATVLDALVAAGAVRLHDADAYNIRRIELGRPAPGHELTEDFTPLEAGLAWTCAENKGCYTGQEIIARQITYDKVTKLLVGLRSEALLPVGAEVTVDGRKSGTVTSATYSPELQGPVALAILKRGRNEPGTTAEVEGETTTVVELPFV